MGVENVTVHRSQTLQSGKASTQNAFDATYIAGFKTALCKSPRENSTRAASNKSNYVIPRSKTSVHLHSFFPSSARLWNVVPSTVKNLNSLDSFKE